MFRRRILPEAGLLLLLLAFTGVVAMADKTPPAPMAPAFSPDQTRYFFSIDLDPRYQVVGVGELTGEEAVKANCYRFLYNPNGRLRQIEYLRADDPQPDPLFQVERIDFEYGPGIERRWYRDAQGRPVACISGNKGEELTLSPAGYPTDVANLDENGAPMRDDSGVVHYVRTLDPSGRIAVGRRVARSGSFITDNDGYFETRSAYDNLDHRIEYGNFDASGQALNNADGVAMIRTTYTIYPDSIQSVESYFDSSGLAVADKSTGAHQCERVTDTRGLLLSKAYFDTTGAPTVDNDERIHESRYEYDDRGNQLSEQYFDPDGKPCNLRREGYARVTYLYDDKNRVIEKAFFGDDGAPQVVAALGAAVVRQDYDDHNTIIRQQFFDGQGQPVINTRYGAPAIRLEVSGDTTTVRLCTADDKPAVNAVYGYAAFSYKTATDKELTRSNRYYDRYDRPITYFPRVSVINPHLYQLKKNPVMKYSARCGAAAAGFGALLAAMLALQKSSYTKRRKVYVPTPGKRLLALLAQFAMAEGAFRFFLTVYWWWLEHQYVRMGHGVQILEAALILYFLHRLYRLHLTMRVLNIGRDDLHRTLRDFFLQSGLNPDWDEARQTYIMPSLRVQVRYYARKYHAYLSFRSQGGPGRQLARTLARQIRAQAKAIQGPARSRAIALYYPSVAFCYFLFSGAAFYTLWQLVKPY